METTMSREGVDEFYDNFLFFGKKKGKKEKRPRREKKQLTPEEQAAKQERRQKFWSNLGESFKEGGTVSNIFGMFNRGGGGAPAPEDYEVGVGEQGGGAAPEEKKGIPTGVIIVGGVAVLAVGYFLYTQSQKNKQAAGQYNPAPAQ